MKKFIIGIAVATGIGASAIFAPGASAAQHAVTASFAFPQVGCPTLVSYNPIVPGWEGSGQLSATQSWSGGICTITAYHYY